MRSIKYNKKSIESLYNQMKEKLPMQMTDGEGNLIDCYIMGVDLAHEGAEQTITMKDGRKAILIPREK